MTCPRCEVQRDILDYKPFDRTVAYESQLNPVYKCPKAKGGCSYIFSPGDEAVLLALFPRMKRDPEDTG